jgi:ubiquitin thioesterase protein OTUB1
MEKTMNSEELSKIFNDSGLSDYIVVFLRLIVSSYLQMNSEFFLSFIDTYSTMKEFCSHEVEPMYRESDHIHIIALTNAISVPVSILYLDRTDQEKATPHNFPEDSQPNIYILYRPGHYDIIYN